MTAQNGKHAKTRELIATLAKLPAVSRIARTVIDPGDVIVIEVARPLSPEEQALYARQLQRAFPHNRILILDAGMTLKIGVERHE